MRGGIKGGEYVNGCMMMLGSVHSAHQTQSIISINGYGQPRVNRKLLLYSGTTIREYHLRLVDLNRSLLAVTDGNTG